MMQWRIIHIAMLFTWNHISHAQVDAEYKMQDAKKLKKEWEMKAKALEKKLNDIQSELVKQMDLYGSFIFGLQMG